MVQPVLVEILRRTDKKCKDSEYLCSAHSHSGADRAGDSSNGDGNNCSRQADDDDDDDDDGGGGFPPVPASPLSPPLPPPLADLSLVELAVIEVLPGAASQRVHADTYYDNSDRAAFLVSVFVTLSDVGFDQGALQVPIRVHARAVQVHACALCRCTCARCAGARVPAVQVHVCGVHVRSVHWLTDAHQVCVMSVSKVCAIIYTVNPILLKKKI